MTYWVLQMNGADRDPFSYDVPGGNIALESHTFNEITGFMKNAAWDSEHGVAVKSKTYECMVWEPGDGQPGFVVSSYLSPVLTGNDPEPQEG